MRGDDRHGPQDGKRRWGGVAEYFTVPLVNIHLMHPSPSPSLSKVFLGLGGPHYRETVKVRKKSE